MGRGGNISAADRLALLKPWQAPTGFVWPYTERRAGEGTRRDHLGQQHFRGQYECFSYSQRKQGVFCKVCVLFGVSDAGGVKMGRLVTTPLQSSVRLTGKRGTLTQHLANRYHADSMQRAHEFRKQHAAGVTVFELQNTAAADERSKNRQALRRILKSIEHLGRLGEPLRGHDDGGALPVDGEISYMGGNFRATLQLMMDSGDTVLKEHLSSAGKNATYISPKSQTI